jgi:DNA polymerase elongation subunit (family B)
LGTPGLLFNSPKDAARITRQGRDFLQAGVSLAEDKGYEIVNVDTDSFSYTRSKVSINEDLNCLNSGFPEEIVWKNDGDYAKLLVIKAKNYVLIDRDGKKTIKGSALKATMKERTLVEFIDNILSGILDEHNCETISNIYKNCALKISNIIDIDNWCSKKTVTASVLNPKRTNEQRILDAVGNKYVQEGDKIYVFFKSETELCLKENYDGEYCKKTLYKKLYNTIKIFNSVLDLELFPNYSLKRNRKHIPVNGLCVGPSNNDARFYDAHSFA